MADDLEGALDELDRRLRALQAELDEVPIAPPEPEHEPGAARGPEPPRAPAREREPEPAPPPAAADPLEAFGVELRRIASELVAAWERVVAAERGRAAGAQRIVLEAQADLHGLAALERALTASPAVRTVDLRAYAGGHASLLVEVAGNAPR
jgi:hypothetical protein